MASSLFSLFHSSSSFSTRSTSYLRFAYTLLPSFRRLEFAGATDPIYANQKTTNDTHIHATVSTIKLEDGAKVMIFRNAVRENIEHLTYQLLDARSKSRWTSLTRVPNPGLATGSVTKISAKSFSSHLSNDINEAQGPAPIDYRSVLQEDEFHKLADSTIHNLLEKLEEYGDSIDLDGFDIDYGNEVLTLKLGDHGTYVVNKQSPNRQIWLSSPVSGPSRYDWDRSTQAWVYRRTQANLLKVMENEIEKLCGKPLNLS